MFKSLHFRSTFIGSSVKEPSHLVIDKRLPQHRFEQNMFFELAVIVIACFFLLFYRLAAFGLVGPDEPTYSRITQEMVNRNDWLTPTLYGKPWLEKPPLFEWSARIAFGIFGMNDWSARLPSVMVGGLVVLALYLFLRRFRQGAELHAALVLVSTVAWIGFSRGASTDMLLSGTFALSMLGWFAWYKSQEKRWLLSSAVALALATLTKGPVAPVLVGASILLFLVLRRDLGSIKAMLWPPAIALYLVLVLPWFIAAQLQYPFFFRVFFIENNFQRFSSNLYQHSQPFWYYLPVFLLGLGAWGVYGGAVIVQRVRRFIAAAREKKPQDDLSLFLLCWIAVPITFFTISQSKLPGYILMVFPAAAALVGDYLQELATAGKRYRGLAIGHIVCCFALVGIAFAAPSFLRYKTIELSDAGWIAIAALLLAFVPTLLSKKIGLQIKSVATLLPIGVVALFLLHPAAEAIDRTGSARSTLLQLGSLDVPELQDVAVYRVKRDIERGLSFYRNDPVWNYDSNEIPGRTHILVSPEGSVTELEKVVASREIKEVNYDSLQHLHYYLVEAQVSVAADR